MNQVLMTIRKITEAFVLVMIGLMAVIISYQVISRFGFNYTPTWIQPMSLLLMVWIGFLGIAIGFQDHSHIRITIFEDQLPVKIKRGLHILQRLLAIVFGLFMFIEGSKFAYDMLGSSIPGIGIPSAVLYVVVPAAGALIITYLLFEFMGVWKGYTDESEVEES
ncbi:TRAP transporter small permease [Guptibacillus hwajinpoensis]|uniref:TRAP-type C4-dicarboxylate transport system permease small subunit n=1 Tax=Guptibacillus hwajinpoensis TaxID=208199 RepID=A0ABU0JZD4_9BACL|nr:TRAP transporter small permease [Alkalihalobacillus hemicentroti]MDQ0482464.1 TRAP-type C4-dicarboxylate transport system permease small subunit [Alkalihalobacillus hemicentroti]